MSLTDFIKLPDVKAKFQAEFHKPNFDVQQELLATSPNGSNYRLVGTAFDYLLRFYIKYQNPHAKERRWVAEYALIYFKKTVNKFNQAKNPLSDHKKNSARGLFYSIYSIC